MVPLAALELVKTAVFEDPATEPSDQFEAVPQEVPAVLFQSSSVPVITCAERRVVQAMAPTRQNRAMTLSAGRPRRDGAETGQTGIGEITMAT